MLSKETLAVLAWPPPTSAGIIVTLQVGVGTVTVAEPHEGKGAGIGIDTVKMPAVG
jgi:hypothetical protein